MDENILAIIILAVLIFAVFHLLAKSAYAILRIALAVLLTIEILYYLRLLINIPFLNQINWSFIDQLNLRIIQFFKTIFTFGSDAVFRINTMN